MLRGKPKTKQVMTRLINFYFFCSATATGSRGRLALHPRIMETFTDAEIQELTRAIREFFLHAATRSENRGMFCGPRRMPTPRAGPCPITLTAMTGSWQPSTRAPAGLCGSGATFSVPLSVLADACDMKAMLDL